MNNKSIYCLLLKSSKPISEELISAINSKNTLGIWELNPFTARCYFSVPDEKFFRKLKKSFPLVTFSGYFEETKDWVTEYERNLRPIKIGRRFIIAPFSELEKVREFSSGKRFPIKLVPGEAFGTGEHFTTSSSIEIMELIKDFPKSVLDVGTGTGILAIAAKRLGAKKIFACDIDPVACKVAKETISLNKMKIQLCVSGPEIFKGTFDLVMANILAETIMDLSPYLNRLTKINGRIILSGIAIEIGIRIKELFTALGFRLDEAMSDGEWWTLLFTKIKKRNINLAI